MDARVACQTSNPNANANVKVCTHVYAYVYALPNDIAMWCIWVRIDTCTYAPLQN